MVLAAQLEARRAVVVAVDEQHGFRAPLDALFILLAAPLIMNILRRIRSRAGETEVDREPRKL